MRIVIDARAASHPQPGGFKTYTMGLIDGLASRNSGNEYILFTDRDTALTSSLGKEFEVRVLLGGPRLIGPGWREQVALPWHLRHIQCDLAHFPYNTAPARCPVPFITTIHDVDLGLHPARFPMRPEALNPTRFLMRLYNRVFTSTAAHQASAIVTDSQTSRRRIIEYYGLPRERVFVIPLAPRAIFRPQDSDQAKQRIATEFGIKGKYILAFGSANPRKNVSRLIQAYAKLTPQLVQNYSLIIVWTHGNWKGVANEMTHKMNVAERVHFLTKVSDDALVSLYNAASLFVFPSLYEGFGLPVLEAMACGAPVVTSNGSSIPEVAGDAAIMVDPRDCDCVAQAMTALLLDEGHRYQLAERARNRAKQFSWDRTAEQLLAVYEDVARAVMYQRTRS